MASETVTTTSAPWSTQQPYLSQIFGLAQGLYGGGGPSYYPGSTVAPLTSTGQNVANQAIQTGLGGGGVLAPAQQQLTDTLSGKYLGANPYLDQMYQRGADQITRQFQQGTAPSIMTNFGMAGRTGSNQQANALDWAGQNYGRNLTDFATSLYGGEYGNERNRQIQALGLVPQQYQSQLAGLKTAQGAVDVLQGQQQAELTDQVQRHQFNQMRPYDALNRYLAAVGGGYGSQGTQTTPLYSNPWATGLGLGLLGLDLFT